MTKMNDDYIDDSDDSGLSISLDSQKAFLFPILKSIVILFMNCIRPQGPKNYPDLETRVLSIYLSL